MRYDLNPLRHLDHGKPLDPFPCEYLLTVPLPVQVEDESKSALLPQKAGSSPEQTSVLEDMIFKISGQLSTISRMQKYFRTRENRNFSTVRSTEQRIFNFSLVEVLMMVGMAALQVLVVRFFFQGARKGEFGCDCERTTIPLLSFLSCSVLVTDTPWFHPCRICIEYTGITDAVRSICRFVAPVTLLPCLKKYMHG